METIYKNILKAEYQTLKLMSNQWHIGVGLNRSTTFGSWRWRLWLNTGYTSRSLSWCRNPDRNI